MTQKFLRRLVNNLYVIIGVVFIWRGAWAILDIVEHRFFGTTHLGFSVGLVLVGLALLYLHDHRYDRLDHF